MDFYPVSGGYSTPLEDVKKRSHVLIEISRYSNYLILAYNMSSESYFLTENVRTY